MSRLAAAEELLAVLMTAQDQVKAVALQHFSQEKLHLFLKELHQHNISTQQQILHDLLERESRQSKNILIEYKKYVASKSPTRFEGMFPEAKTSSVERRTPKPQLRRPPTVLQEIEKTIPLVPEPSSQAAPTPQVVANQPEKTEELPIEQEHNIPAPLEITDIQIAFADETQEQSCVYFVYALESGGEQAYSYSQTHCPNFFCG